MDKNKLIAGYAGILLAILLSFLGNVGVGKAPNDPQVIKEAIQEGIKAGLVEATKSKVEEAKPLLPLMVKPIVIPPALLSYDATVTKG